MILVMEAARWSWPSCSRSWSGWASSRSGRWPLILALARICVTFELPSRQVFFYDLVGQETLPNAIALNSGLFNATRVLGPALAGAVPAVLGATGCFALNGLSYLAAIAAVCFDPAAQEGSGSRSGRASASRRCSAASPTSRRDRRMLAHFLLDDLLRHRRHGLRGHDPRLHPPDRRGGRRGVQRAPGVRRHRGDGRRPGVASLGQHRAQGALVHRGDARLRRRLWRPPRSSALGRPRLAGRSPAGARPSACLLGAGFGPSSSTRRPRR